MGAVEQQGAEVLGGMGSGEDWMRGSWRGWGFSIWVWELSR